MFSLVVELALVVVLVSLLPEKWRQHTTSVLMLCGVAMWGVAASGLFR
jgi:hypothetical protein